jgi:hypothetical protein
MIKRERRFEDDLVGHLWKVGSSLCALSELTEELTLSGIAFLDRRFVKRIDRDFERRQIYAAALRSELPNSLVTLHKKYDQDSKQEVLAIAKSSRTLVALHPELDNPDVCFIGFAKQVTAKSVVLRAISSFGETLPEPKTFELRAVTKIEIGTGYLRGLSRFLRSTHGRTT